MTTEERALSLYPDIENNDKEYSDYGQYLYAQKQRLAERAAYIAGASSQPGGGMEWKNIGDRKLTASSWHYRDSATKRPITHLEVIKRFCDKRTDFDYLDEFTPSLSEVVEKVRADNPKNHSALKANDPLVLGYEMAIYKFELLIK